MNESELLRQLGRTAEDENPPRVDIAAPVMARLHELRDNREPVWCIGAAVAALAAAMVALIAAPMWFNWHEQLYPLASLMDTVLQ